MKPIEQARLDLEAAKASRTDDFMKRFEQVAEMADKLKKVMIKRGLTAAKAKCAMCDGYLHGRLVGRRQHLHMGCDGPCKAFFME